MNPTSRSITRRSPAWLLSVSAGLAALLAVLMVPGSARPQSPVTKPVLEKLIGTSSCAARGCHGAVGPVDPAHGNVFIPDGSFTTWRHYDPHARAFDVLKNDRSVRIVESLNKSKNLKLDAPSKSRMCLACHSTVVAPEFSRGGAIASDGVSCESCHGPAKDWLEPHRSLDWRNNPESQKRDGLTDLSTASGRAQTCVACHVGDRSRGMDVNHDLIAAGHPRLNFEYASYLASYPKHWKEPHEETAATDRKIPTKADFEVRSWLVGQLVTQKAVVKLAGDRARLSIDEETRPNRPADGKPMVADAVWPEFAESECFACHQGLTKDSPSRKSGRLSGSGLGQLPWATWPLAMSDEVNSLLKPDQSTLPDLRALMGQKFPDPSEVAKKSVATAAELDGWIARLEAAPITSADMKSLIQLLSQRSPDPAQGWDQAAQVYLARAVMARSGGIDPEAESPDLKAAYSKKTLDSILAGLRFPVRQDSPKR